MEGVQMMNTLNIQEWITQINFANAAPLSSELKKYGINKNYYHALQTIIVHFRFCVMKLLTF